MSFINHFKSSLKKGQSIVEFLVLATAIIAAVAFGGPYLLSNIANSSPRIINRSAAKMGVTLRGNATDFVPDNWTPSVPSTPSVPRTPGPGGPGIPGPGDPGYY